MCPTLPTPPNISHWSGKLATSSQGLSRGFTKLRHLHTGPTRNPLCLHRCSTVLNYRCASGAHYLQVHKACHLVRHLPFRPCCQFSQCGWAARSPLQNCRATSPPSLTARFRIAGVAQPASEAGVAHSPLQNGQRTARYKIAEEWPRVANATLVAQRTLLVELKLPQNTPRVA